MKQLLIGVSGKARAGKDTTGQFFINNYGFNHYAFASPLKKGCEEMFFGIDSYYFKDENKEKIIPGWNISYRKILQLVGTEIGRAINKDCWIKNAQSVWENIKEKKLIVTDVRFNNEAEWIHSNGGKVFYIERNNGSIEESSHSSETSLDLELVDEFLINNTSISDLYSQIKRILSHEKIFNNIFSSSDG